MSCPGYPARLWGTGAAVVSFRCQNDSRNVTRNRRRQRFTRTANRGTRAQYYCYIPRYVNNEYAVHDIIYSGGVGARNHENQRRFDLRKKIYVFGGRDEFATVSRNAHTPRIPINIIIIVITKKKKLLHETRFRTPAVRDRRIIRTQSDLNNIRIKLFEHIGIVLFVFEYIVHFE